MVTFSFYSLFITSQSLATEIVWVTDAPQNNVTAKNKVLDIDTSTFNLLAAHLNSQYFFKKLHVPVKRGFTLIKHQENVCIGNKLTTKERNEFSYSTQIPQTVFPGLRLYINKNSPYFQKVRQLVTQQKTVSIYDIINTVAGIKFGIVGGRSYGVEIDSLINSPENAHFFWKRHASKANRGIVNMIEKARFDISIEYPNVFGFYSEEDNTVIESFPLKEAPNYMLGNILCSKSKIGAKMVKAFNAVIKTTSKTREYFDAHMKWFDSSSQEDAARYYNKIYKTSFTLKKPMVN
ncbi:hypothetical protein [Thalassotalea sp. SU-HH00458]|uniref:hypothetical protein n=1 Tax=Thalassotalea sp. SU-HH00458 TaxID=3127657 RepID=UPI0031097F42